MVKDLIDLKDDFISFRLKLGGMNINIPVMNLLDEIQSWNIPTTEWYCELEEYVYMIPTRVLIYSVDDYSVKYNFDAAIEFIQSKIQKSFNIYEKNQYILHGGKSSCI